MNPTEKSSKISLPRLAKVRAQNSSRLSGTSLMGYVRTSYHDLVDLLGEPTSRGSEDNKVSVEWVLVIGDTVATIYDYKGDCLMTSEVSWWHVGGHTQVSLSLVDALTGFETKGVR